jgi:hypothetical protein
VGSVATKHQGTGFSSGQITASPHQSFRGDVE